MAQKQPNLWKRGNVYYLRMRVPVDLREVLGKEFITQSLKTTDRREAVERLRLAQGHVQRTFDEARNQARVPGRTERLIRRGQVARLSSAELEGLVRQWFGSELDKVKGGIAMPSDSEAIEAILQESDEEYAMLRSASPTDYGASVWETVRRLLVANDAPTTPPAAPIIPLNANLHPLALSTPLSELKELAVLVRRARLILNRAKRERIEAGTHVPPDHLFQTNGNHQDIGAGGATLDRLIREFGDDPSRPSMTDKTRLDYGMVFRVLREVIGGDTPVRGITRREHCLPVRELLQRIPANATKKFPGKSLEYAARQAEKKDLPRLNPQTINSHLNKMSTMFNWAVKEELMERNPAVGLAIEYEADVEDGRRSFTQAELQRMFSAPLYTGCRDDERNFSKPGPNHPRRSRFWVPLIALFAGMRQNEICQLLPGDIDEIAGIPVIRIQRTYPWQKLKSRQARRVVPIHPELLKIGFLQYVSAVRTSGADILFPDLTIGARGYMAASFQKRFTTFLASVGIADGDATFHSFRHTWRDALRQARVPEERVQAVGGWTGSGQDKRYGNWFESPELVEEIAAEIGKIGYRDLDLSPLYLSLAESSSPPTIRIRARSATR